MIKQGVSFYSYQTEYAAGRMSLEDMIAEVHDLGCDGIELVPTQTPPSSYPAATEEEIDRWFSLMDKYGTRPVCLDSIIVCDDFYSNLFKKRQDPAMLRVVYENASLEKQEELFRQELELCHQLGFPIIRIPKLYGVQMPVFEKLLPLAESYGITLGLEIHVPMRTDGPEVEEYLEFIDRTGTPFAGLIPDMAIFATKLPRRLVRQALTVGADPDFIALIEKTYEEKGDLMALKEEALSKGHADEGTTQVLTYAIRNVTSRVEDLRRILPYVKHFHAKFYDCNQDYVEEGIRFDEVIPILMEAGYDGYLNSEYEGQKLYGQENCFDEVEQVRRQHIMVSRLLNAQ